MNSRTYVSDPSLWETFYKNMADRKFSPYKYKKTKNNRKQIGRGRLHGRYRGSYLIPVNRHAVKEDDKVHTDLVTPVAAAEERALSEYKEEKEHNEPRVKLNKRIKKTKKTKNVIKKKVGKRSTSKKKSSKKKSNKKKKSGSKKRSLNSDYYDNVWNQQSRKKKRNQ